MKKKDYYEIPLKDHEITYHFWHRSIFDYIFVKNVSSSSLASSNVLFSESRMSPNEIQGSDHYPIKCILKL